MAVDDELDVLEEQPARRPWWSRLWNLVRSDWPATSLAVVAIVVAAIMVQQVRTGPRSSGQPRSRAGTAIDCTTGVVGPGVGQGAGAGTATTAGG